MLAGARLLATAPSTSEHGMPLMCRLSGICVATATPPAAVATAAPRPGPHFARVASICLFYAAQVALR